MSSREEIKVAYTNELKLTPQYQIVLKLKQHILDEIHAPNVQPFIKYDYDHQQTLEDLDVIRACILIEFGFLVYTTDLDFIQIEMIKFIQEVARESGI
jgi:hypothetical protein